jgi:adenylyl-sulfate kinase
MPRPDDGRAVRESIVTSPAKAALGAPPAAALRESVVAAQISRHIGHVPIEQREHAFRQRALTLWMTGLSGAGKSSIAYALEHRLFELGHPCYVLDGDNLRHHLNRDLGFSDAERSENIRRTAEVARLMNDAGLIVVTALISPLRQDRDIARRIVGVERFVEIHVSTGLDVCEARDPKGLYAKARAGGIPAFTGISAPYEAPRAPALQLDTQALCVDAAVDRLVELLRRHGRLDRA